MKHAGLLLVMIGCDNTVLRPCGELSPDWHGVQCTVNTHCISCHGEVHDSPPVQFTVLPSDLITDLLDEEHILVVPGDPSASQLWRVLSGELDPALDGWGIMPYGYATPLPTSEIEHVRVWIEEGAELEGAR